MCLVLVSCVTSKLTTLLRLSGDVDSGDDNESARNSNLSNNSQHLLHPPNLAASPNPRATPNYHRHVGSSSAAASPTTVPSTINELSQPGHSSPLQDFINNLDGSAQSQTDQTLDDQPKQRKISNLDLISGVDGKATAFNRHLRLRVYGNNRTGMVRHETKL